MNHNAPAFGLRQIKGCRCSSKRCHKHSKSNPATCCATGCVYLSEGKKGRSIEISVGVQFCIFVEGCRVANKLVDSGNC